MYPGYRASSSVRSCFIPYREDSRWNLCEKIIPSDLWKLYRYCTESRYFRNTISSSSAVPVSYAWSSLLLFSFVLFCFLLFPFPSVFCLFLFYYSAILLGQFLKFYTYRVSWNMSCKRNLNRFLKYKIKDKIFVKFLKAFMVGSFSRDMFNTFSILFHKF